MGKHMIKWFEGDHTYYRRVGLADAIKECLVRNYVELVGEDKETVFNQIEWSYREIGQWPERCVEAEIEGIRFRIMYIPGPGWALEVQQGYNQRNFLSVDGESLICDALDLKTWGKLFWRI